MADSTTRTRGTRAAATRARPAPVAPVRGRLPAVAPAKAEALRRFFGTARRWHLPDGGRLRFLPGVPAADGETFAVDAEGTRLALALYTGHPSGEGLQWCDYSGRARVLAWSLAHEPQLVRLSEALGVSLLPIAGADQRAGQAPGDEDAVWLEFDVDGPDPAPAGGACRGVLKLPMAWLDRLGVRSGDLYGEQPPAPLDAWEALPAPVALRFPGPRLHGDEWRRLQCGDVVVIGGSGRLPSVSAHAIGRRWSLVEVAGGWRVDGDAASPVPGSDLQQENRMSDIDSTGPAGPADPAAAAPAADGDRKRELPVQLDFELARTELSIGELAELQPGYVFALPVQLEGSNVSIRANGRAVGRGELVAVGETLGVRLVAWS